MSKGLSLNKSNEGEHAILFTEYYHTPYVSLY
jgi:hypothetical protein